MIIVCVVCHERVSTRKGDVRVECRCGMEYQALTGRPVDEPICGLLHPPYV